MRDKRVSTTIDRRNGSWSVFTEQFRRGVSMSEQLRKERARLFNGVKQKEDAKR